MTDQGITYDIQKFSLDDGPGIRTIVFFKGCPLRCKWCANPESQLVSQEIGHHYTRCIECGKCAANCPKQAISMIGGDKKLMIDRTKCVVCGTCVKGCIYRAFSIYGRKSTVEELYEDIDKDRVYYNRSGGGVTLSGGEILMQADFAAALLKRCKEGGLHTCVETCGYASEEQFKKIVPYVDMFLYDLKSLNDEVHKKWTGCSNEPILRNLDIAMESDSEVVIRWPLIPTVNNTEENLALMRNKLVELNKRKPVSVEILPYHNYGSGKYTMTHREYELSELKTPPAEEVEKVKKMFEDVGVTCILHKT